MLSAVQRWKIQWRKHQEEDEKHRHRPVRLLGLLLLVAVLAIETLPLVSVKAAPLHPTQSTSVYCDYVYFSPSGNPFSLCPGPYPAGGNCVWWAWEQWHLLGYDLPLNWGNAADWVVDATRSGFAVGTTPRVGAIAVFPKADGVWAYGYEGHVAFVTFVHADGMTFDVTYQNYGDSTYMYSGTNYNVSFINQPHYQDGQLRFIYFPYEIDPVRFSQLPGVQGTDKEIMSSVETANTQVTEGPTNARVHTPTFTNDRHAFGVIDPDGNQRFNADFDGKGIQDVLLYDRQRGDLSVLRLRNQENETIPLSSTDSVETEQEQANTSVETVSLGDPKVASGKWGSSLDVYVGEFSGTGETNILLYNRDNGEIHILSLNSDLSIKKHEIIDEFGPGWELYSGRFDGERTSLFMYKRFAFEDSSNSDSNENSNNQNHAGGKGPVPTLTPEITPTPTSTPEVTPTPTPTPTSTPEVTPTPTPEVTPTPTPSPTPEVTPTPTLTPEVTPTPTPTSTPEVTPTPTPSPTSTSTPEVTPAPTPVVTPSPTPEEDPSASEGEPPITTDSISFSQLAFGDEEEDDEELSDEELAEWQEQGRTANIMLIDFDKDLQVRTRQQYTLWHANWEVYTGRYLSAERDALFLYDRTVGIGRLIGFDQSLQLDKQQEMRDLRGNWQIYSGDFANQGQAQMLLYDPSTGDAQILSFDEELKQEERKKHENLGTHQVLYVGHFGLETLSIMLYDPENAQSTFIGFDDSLEISQQYLASSWDQSHQILIGSFLNVADCEQADSCLQADDILVLNRETGEIEQYAFAFGQTVETYDNRSQAFIRLGVDTRERINVVDTTLFTHVATLKTTIRNQELY